MARRHKPRRGSLGFWPRKRAPTAVPRINRWPHGPAKPHLEGFAGYKVGMTHAIMVDFRKRSTTSGQEVSVPVTVVETPPIIVDAVRVYKTGPKGRYVSSEIWNPDLDQRLARRRPIPSKDEDAEKSPRAKGAKKESADGEDLVLVVHTQPHLVTGVPSKTPEIFEVRVSGEKFSERLEWSKALLGKEVKMEDFAHEGEMVDIVSVTKGKGFQGHIKRFHVKLQPHKNSKHRRMIGTLGPHNPSYVTYRIPQSGQMGYHRRTEFNKRILKIVSDPSAYQVNPNGGFLHYGMVRGTSVILHGSIGGPSKRLVRFRLPMRFRGGQEKIDIRYLSTQSKRGG